MNTNEFQRLLGFWHAKRIQNEHRPLNSSKRSTKGHAKGVGQILKGSFIKPLVPIEKVFIKQ